MHNSCSEFNKDQQAVIDLAKSSRKGLNRTEAEILVEWAKEYGLNNHAPMIHPLRHGQWSFIEHIKVFKTHIPIIK